MAKKAAKKKTTKKTAAKKTTATKATKKKVTKKKVTRKKTTTKAAAKKASPKVIVLTHDEIAARAFQVWEEKGKPHGEDAAIWKEAEALLKAELSS